MFLINAGWVSQCACVFILNKNINLSVLSVGVRTFSIFLNTITPHSYGTSHKLPKFNPLFIYIHTCVCVPIHTYIHTYLLCLHILINPTWVQYHCTFDGQYRTYVHVTFLAEHLHHCCLYLYSNCRSLRYDDFSFFHTFFNLFANSAYFFLNQ